MVLSHIQGASPMCPTPQTLISPVRPHAVGPYGVALAGVGLME